jgi:NTE family protein
VNKKEDFALVLGGGGVKGLAHIALLKELDRLQVKPSLIVGTSMGAIMGGLYASGVCGEEIEARVRSHIINPGESAKDIFKKHKELLTWLKVFSFERSRGGFFAAQGLFDHLFSEVVDLDFKDLDIPIISVATNYYTGKAVELSRRNVLSAIKASMAVPGVFAPVMLDDQLLVDGGLVNNLPCDVAAKSSSLIIASDVISLPEEKEPSTWQIMSGALHIMLEEGTNKRLQDYPVDFIFKPNTSGIDAFDFMKIATVLEQADKEAQDKKAKLSSILLS